VSQIIIRTLVRYIQYLSIHLWRLNCLLHLHTHVHLVDSYDSFYFCSLFVPLYPSYIYSLDSFTPFSLYLLPSQRSPDQFVYSLQKFHGSMATRRSNGRPKAPISTKSNSLTCAMAGYSLT